MEEIPISHRSDDSLCFETYPFVLILVRVLVVVLVNESDCRSFQLIFRKHYSSETSQHSYARSHEIDLSYDLVCSTEPCIVNMMRPISGLVFKEGFQVTHSMLLQGVSYSVGEAGRGEAATLYWLQLFFSR